MTSLGIGLLAVIIIVVIIGRIWRRKIIREEYEKMREPENSYTLVIKHHSFGDSVDKIIINAGQQTASFTEEDLKPEAFNVTVSYEGMNSQNTELSVNTTTREIASAYFCDINGDEIEYTPLLPSDKNENAPEEKKDSYAEPPHIALELYTTEYEESARPFIRGIENNNIRKKQVFDYEISHRKFKTPVNNCYDWISVEE